MFRATTPKHSFIFQTDASDFQKILITYSQDDRIILEKDEDDLTFETGSHEDGTPKYVAYVELTQEETIRFSLRYGDTVKVQVRVLDQNDRAWASEIKYLPLKEVLDDEVL